MRHHRCLHMVASVSHYNTFMSSYAMVEQFNRVVYNDYIRVSPLLFEVTFRYSRYSSLLIQGDSAIFPGSFDKLPTT